jgi:hypothetical protein
VQTKKVFLAEREMWRAETQVDKMLFRSSTTTYQTMIDDWETFEHVPNVRNANNFRITRDGTAPRLLKKKSDWNEYNMQIQAYSKSNRHFLEPIFISDTTTSASADDDHEAGMLWQIYLEGAVSLAKYMKENEKNIDALRDVLVQLRTAIHFLKDLRIEHGDLDADANILVNGGQVVIIDFDRAKVKPSPENLVFDYPAFLSKELRDEFQDILFRKTNTREPPPLRKQNGDRVVRQRTESGLRLGFDDSDTP